MKEVLYITYDGLTDTLGQSQILPYVIGLSKNARPNDSSGRGYSFTVISCEKPDKFEKGRKNIEALCLNHNIEWHPLIYHKRPPVLSTLWDVFAIRKKAFDLNKKKNFSIVHCRSYISALVGLELKRKKNVAFIFDMRGFYADERVDGNLWDLSNPFYWLIYKFFKSKEAAFVQHSDAIISLTEAAKKTIMDWPTMKYANKITVIPCSVDMELFSKDSLDLQILEKMKTDIGSHMIITYNGSLGTWYMLSEMLDQFKVIKEKYSNAKFLIITQEKWDANNELLSRSKKIDPTDIIIKSAERNEMPYYMALTNIAIFFIKPSYSKLATSPTKHGEMMSMGIPLITNSGIGDVDQIVEDSKSGYIIHNFTESEYVKAADNISELMKIDPKLIRESCKKIYSLETAVAKYQKVYASITE